MTTAQAFNLGDGHDRLLRLEVAADQEGASNERQLVVVMLDKSGSMGRFVAMAERGVGEGLLERGFSLDDQIDELTFSDQIGVDRPTVRDLINSKRRCEGGTYMRGIFNPAARLLMSADNESKPCQIIMISDGQVADKKEISDQATKFAQVISKRSGPISVVLIRLKTGYNADPDTRALTYIGQLNTQGVVPINDISCTERESAGEDNVTKMQIATTVSSHLSSTGGQTWEVKTEERVFRRLPTDTYRNMIIVPAGANFLLVKPDIDLTNLKMTLAGKPVLIGEVESGLESEADISDLLDYIEQQIRLWMVMGAQEEQIEKTMAWLRSLAGRLVEPASVEDNATLKGRAAMLKKTIYKRERSAINRILQLQNEKKIDALNSQQAADFLRKVNDNRSGKRLARRAQGRDAEFDYDKLCVEALVKLSETEIPEGFSEAHDSSLTSFYSQFNGADVIIEAKEAKNELANVLDDASADDLLQLLGGIGVAYQGPTGDFPDPWRYYVTKVFPGCYLAQADLWMAHTQGRGRSLTPPGHTDVITGVDVIRAPNREVYDLFARRAREILELQASISMRRLKLRVPGDEIALKTAVTFRLIQEMACPPTELQARTIRWQLFDLNHMLRTRFAKTFEQLASDLKEEQVGAYLTGDRDISGAMQPICCLLGDPRVNALVAVPEQCARILRALYSLEVYHRVRGLVRSKTIGDNWMAENDKQLHNLLGIDLRANGPEVGFNALPEDQIVWPDTYDRSRLERETKAYEPLNVCPSSLSRVVAVRRTVEALGDTATLDQAIEEFTKQVGTLDPPKELELQVTPERYHAVCVVQAMVAPDLNQRVDTATRTMKIPEILTDDAIDEFIKSTIQRIYREDYQKRKAAWAIEMKERQALELAFTRGLGDFIEDLGKHTHTGHTRRSFWDTVAGAMRSGDVQKVQAFVNKSNTALHNGGRFRKFLRLYGSEEMRNRDWGKFRNMT